MKRKGIKKYLPLKMKCMKMSETDIMVIQEKANKYERGNFSEWVRRAGREYDPPKKGEGGSGDFY